MMGLISSNAKTETLDTHAGWLIVSWICCRVTEIGGSLETRLYKNNAVTNILILSHSLTHHIHVLMHMHTHHDIHAMI